MLGLLTGASGTGALIAAISLAARKSVVGLLSTIQRSAMLFGGGLIVFGFSHHVALSLGAMALAGWGMMQGLAASNTVIQTLVPEEKRGRVMSYYTMAFVGMMPFGSLLSGALAHGIGAADTVLITGSCVLLGGLLFWTQRAPVRAAMRLRYEELGILAPKAAASVLS